MRDLEKQLAICTPPSTVDEIAGAVSPYWPGPVLVYTGRQADALPPGLLTALGQDELQYVVEERGVGLFLAEGFLCCDIHILGVWLCTLMLPAGPVASQEAIGDAMALCLFIRRGLAENPLLSQRLGSHPDLFLARQDGALKEICCLYCDCRGLLPRRAALLCNEAGGKLSACHTFRSAGGFSLLFSCPGHEGEDPFEGLEAFLKENRLQGGLCGPFERAASARGCLSKAMRACSLGMRTCPEEHLHSFAALRFTAFCQAAEELLFREKLSMEDFCHHALSRLRDCDRERGSEYYDTLYSYLRFGRNLKAAAKALGVHRNTLAYRIGRIEALFGLDLNDTNTCFELLFSFRMCENPIFHRGNGPHLLEAERRSALEALEDERLLWAVLRDEGCASRSNSADAHGCVLVMVDAGPLSDGDRAALLQAALAVQGDAASAMEEDGVYFLFHAREEERPALLEAFGEKLGRLGCQGAASQLFPACAISKHMRFTRLTLRAGRELGVNSGLLRAEDYCSIVFFLFLQQAFPLSPYYCDEVIRVLDHDFEKGSDLSKSLYVYLSSFMDMKDAAQEVAIHRNTLEYQLKKIEGILGGQSFDERLRFEMMCTYRMLTVAGQSF